MNQGYNPQGEGPWTSGLGMTVGQESTEAQLAFVRKTYVLFMAGILTCIMAGFFCLNVESIYNAAIGILRMPILAFGLIIGGSIAAQAIATKPGLDYLALFGFTGLLGFLFAPIVNTYLPSVVGQAGVMTVVIFGALTAYVFITRKDFSFMGGLLFVGMISMIIGGLINAFWLKSSGFSYIMSWFVLFLSSGFVLYQTSNLVHQHRRGQECLAALGLFVSFFNIFMSLLNILGGNRD
jgi:FtsH-binding integral membrane protein